MSDHAVKLYYYVIMLRWGELAVRRGVAIESVLDSQGHAAPCCISACP